MYRVISEWKDPSGTVVSKHIESSAPEMLDALLDTFDALKQGAWKVEVRQED